MRRLLVLLSVVGFSMAAFAQVTIPGTFSTLPAQPGTSLYAPVLSTPTLSLGNGLTPGVVTNQPSYFISAPQNMPLVSSLVNAPVEYEPPVAIAAQTENESNPNSNVASAPNGVRPMFDFIVAGNGSASCGSDSGSLAEVAAAARRTAVQPGHVYTNEDIARINQKYGSSKTTPNPTLNASSDN